MPGFQYDGKLRLNRLPGYIANSEWHYRNNTSFVGAYAANTVVTANAAGAARVRNVITEWQVCAFGSAAAFNSFFFLLDGLVLGGGANALWFYQNQLTNRGDNYHIILPPDNPIIGSLAAAVGILSTGAGAAGCAVEVVARGYQIAD